MWQTPLFRARHKRVRRHAKHNADLGVVDLDARHDRADQLPAGIPVGGVELLADLAGELFQPTDQQPEILVQRGVVGELARLLLKAGQALPQARDPWLELLLVDQPLGVAVDQPGHPWRTFGRWTCTAARSAAARQVVAPPGAGDTPPRAGGSSSKPRTSCQTAASSRSVRTWVLVQTRSPPKR